MSSVGHSSIGDNHELNQERHPMDLATKATTMKSTELVRSNISAPTSGQLRVGRPQNVVATNTAIQTGISTYSQTMLKHVNVARTCATSTSVSSLTLAPVGAIRSPMPATVAMHAPVPASNISLPQGGSIRSTLPATGGLHTTAPSNITTTYHVPRGAAAVANIAPPRSAVATPIVRATAGLQAGSVTVGQHPATFGPGLRTMGPSTLLARAPSPVTSVVGAAWLSAPGVSQLQKPVRAPAATTLASYTQAIAVTARPVVQVESPRSQILQTAIQKPVQTVQDKSYYKPSVAALTIAHTQPGHGTATLIATQSHHTLTLSQGSSAQGAVRFPPCPRPPATRFTVTPTTAVTGRLSVAPRLSLAPGAMRIATPTQTRLVTTGLPTPAGVVSLHPVVMAASSPTSLPLKPTSRTVTTHHTIGPKVVAQSAHGPAQIPVSSVAAKIPQSLHSMTPLQQAATTRTVAHTATTSSQSGVITPQTIPVAKVFPTAASRTTAVTEVSIPVQQAVVSTPQATSVFIQTSHNPASGNGIAQGERPTGPAYTLPTTYYYETPSVYQVAGMGSSLVARPYSPYTVQTATTPAVRPGLASHQVHSIVSGGQPVRFNPVMVVDSSRSSVALHPSYVTEGTLMQPESQALGQSSQPPVVTKPNASPRPSILRKRDNEGSPLKAQKNLAPMLAALSSNICNVGPPSPPSPRRPDSRGNGGNLSGGSTTISATSSPGLGEGGEDSLPPIKEEPAEEMEKPPVEMSPRKKPRKQQLTGNELHEPKFSEDEMEFISEEKIKKEVKEVAEEGRVYIPKRPPISLMNSYRHSWKSRHNHYVRYTDVKVKDERRPTVTDLANQKHVYQKLNGWKVYHLSTQMEDLSDLETQVFEKLSVMLKVMETKSGKDLDKDRNRVNELIKGNIQRSKVIKDQMQEAKSQVMKIFDHKGQVTDIIKRCANKRNLKKRDKS